MSFCEKCVSYDMCNYEYEHCDTDAVLTFFPNNTDCPWFKDRSSYKEIRRGRWTGKQFNWDGDYPILEKSHYLKCSECGCKHFLYIYDFWGRLHKCSTSDIPIIIPNFCPNCGAKMNTQ